MAQVFMSYSRKDKDFVRRLNDALVGQKREAWVDWKDIPLTAEWQQEILTNIETTENFVFVISPESAASPNCKKEIDHAVANHKRMFPIVRRRVPDDAVPEELRKFQWIDFSDDDTFEPRFATLVAALDTDLAWVNVHTRLLTRAKEWEREGKDKSFLLHGKDLREAERWVAQSSEKDPKPTTLQSQYILASRQAATKLQRTVIGAVTLAFLVAVGLAVIAFLQRNLAQRETRIADASATEAKLQKNAADQQKNIAIQNEKEAQRQQRIATENEGLAKEETAVAQRNERESKARELAAFSTESLREDPEKSIILGMQAVNATLRFGQPPVPTAEQALHQAILSSRVRMTLRGHSHPVYGVAFSPDGKRLATSSHDYAAKVWDAESGKELLTLRGHTPGILGSVSGVAFSPDGTRLATASSDGTAKVWHTESGKELLTLRGHMGGVLSVAFSPDGKRLATASGDGTAKVWDTESGKELLTLRGHSRGVNGLAFSPDGKHLATAGHDQTAKVWDAESGKILLTLSGHSGPVNGVVFSPDGKRLATASGDGTAKVWDGKSGKESVILKAWEAEGDDGAGGDANSSIRVTASRDKSLLSVAFSPDGKRLLTTSADENATIWNAESGEELLPLRGDFRGAQSVAFSPSGKRVFVGAEGKTAIVVDLAKTMSELDAGKAADESANSVRPLLILQGDLSNVHVVAFSPDSKRLLAASGVQAKIWDGESGKELLTLRGHSGSVNGLAFSPDGKRIATASDDQTAKVWNSESGKELLTLRGHSGPVKGVAFSHDGKRLATASEDGTVQVYAFDLRELLKLARRRVTRDLSAEECKRYFQSATCPPLP